jgi:hypothetical protein
MRRAVATGAAIGGGLAFLVAGTHTGADSPELMRLVILGVALGAVVATDLAEHRIPNRIVVPAAIACAGKACSPLKRFLRGTYSAASPSSR